MVTRTRSDFGLIVLGLVLLVVGGYYVLANTLGFDLNWDMVWPFLILGLGVLFLIRAFTVRGEEPPHSEPHAPPGS